MKRYWFFVILFCSWTSAFAISNNVQPLANLAIDEDALYQKVIHETSQEASDSKFGSNRAEKTALSRSASRRPEIPLMKISFLVGFLALGWFVIKKRKSISLENKKGIFKTIGKLARGSFGNNEKLIQIMSTHYLDPKKKLVVARVMNRVLVLGVASESINLITQFIEDPQSASVDDGTSLAQGAVFDQLLESEKDRPFFIDPSHSMANRMANSSMNGAAGAIKSGSGNGLGTDPGIDNDKSGARSRIKSRLEGMRPL